MKVTVIFKNAKGKSIGSANFRKLTTAKAHVVRCAQIDWDFVPGLVRRPTTFEQSLKFYADDGVTVSIIQR